MLTILINSINWNRGEAVLKSITDGIKEIFKTIIRLTINLFFIMSIVYLFKHRSIINPFKVFYEYMINTDIISHMIYYLLGGSIDTYRNTPIINVYQSDNPYELIKAIDQVIIEEVKLKHDIEEGSQMVYVPKRKFIFSSKITLLRVGKYVILEGKRSTVNKVNEEVEKLKYDGEEAGISFRILEGKEGKKIKRQYLFEY